MTKVTFNLELKVNPGEVIALVGSTAELGEYFFANGSLGNLGTERFLCNLLSHQI
jgi:hypothetical protein